uniref:F-box associated domain-containing protein n=1 Tax=Fagus sylvatica TaxID=28930 RepID=A0A2N9GNG7_FAGSY
MGSKRNSTNCIGTTTTTKISMNTPALISLSMIQAFPEISNVIGTYNGLVCLAEDFMYRLYDFILWNPCVRKFVELPPPNVSIQHTRFVAMNLLFPPEVEVYSLAIGEWRMVTALAPIGDVCGRGTQAFINGALHCIAMQNVTHNKSTYFVMLAISAYGNSLALFHDTDRALNIWVMKERSGEVILENLREQLVSCDLESQKIKDLGIAGYGYTFAGSYVESLVLLDKPNRAVTY